MKKRIISVVCLLFAAVLLLAVPVSAGNAYQTYTYSKSGETLYSPDAYTPIKTIDYNYMGLPSNLENARDIVVDANDNVYLADSGNNRVICLDRYFKLRFIITDFVNEEGIDDTLSNPSGIFVTADKIYVADTNKNRIVLFDLEGNFIRIIGEPTSDLFDVNSVYKPVALVVDDYDRMYVVSSTTYQGVIVMDSDGTFISFIGAQQVSISAWDKIWRKFQTKDQQAAQQSIVPTEYNNIDMDEDGFIYVTSSTISESKVSSSLSSKDGKYAPVKMINKSGDEVMARNGFWAPSGEIDIKGKAASGATLGVSVLVDVAVGPEKTWSIIDERRQRIFTYDDQGNLLFAFGDSGSQLGNLTAICAICYMGDATMLVLDKTSDNITVYKRTEYGDILIKALANQNARQYDRAVEDWTEILKRNSNFDVAYVGIGDALYRTGKNEEALEYYKAAYATGGWSNAYKEIRKEWISKNVLLIPLFIVVVILLVTWFLKWAGKVNKKAETSGTRRTFKEELLFAFHLIVHPFDGFWDLKHEKRGSVRAGIVYIIITILAMFYKDIGSGYLANPSERYGNIGSDALSILVPLALWIVANWCLTTLFDGEGSFKDIFIACSYSLLPIPIFMIPTTIFSNVAISTELQIINLLNTIALIWCFLLIFCGMMVTHDYSIGKNLITTLGTLVAMVFIMFIAILFTTLLGKIVSFITNIFVEINYRV